MRLSPKHWLVSNSLRNFPPLPTFTYSLCFAMSSDPTQVFQHAYYIGNFLSGILYGVELVMYFMTLQALLRNKSRSWGQVKFLLLFSTTMLCLLTVDVSTNSVWGEQMWITFRDQPGGVPTYISKHVVDWYEILGTTSVAVMILMGDAFIIYRCFVIWNQRLWIIAFPILMWLGTLALAICQLVASAVPNGSFFGGRAINFGIPYYTLSISLNVIMSSLIIGRILYISKKVEAALGHKRACMYTSVSATIVESALPYALIGFMFLVPYGLSSETAIGFGQVYAKLTCLAPQFIILRVARGIAWDHSVVTGQQDATNMTFDAEKNQSNTLHPTSGLLSQHSQGTLRKDDGSFYE